MDCSLPESSSPTCGTTAAILRRLSATSNTPENLRSPANGSSVSVARESTDESRHPGADAQLVQESSRSSTSSQTSTTAGSQSRPSSHSANIRSPTASSQQQRTSLSVPSSTVTHRSPQSPRSPSSSVNREESRSPTAAALGNLQQTGAGSQSLPPCCRDSGIPSCSTAASVSTFGSHRSTASSQSRPSVAPRLPPSPSVLHQVVSQLREAATAATNSLDQRQHGNEADKSPEGSTVLPTSPLPSVQQKPTDPRRGAQAKVSGCFAVEFFFSVPARACL